MELNFYKYYAAIEYLQTYISKVNFIVFLCRMLKISLLFEAKYFICRNLLMKEYHMT